MGEMGQILEPGFHCYVVLVSVKLELVFAVNLREKCSARNNLRNVHNFSAIFKARAICSKLVPGGYLLLIKFHITKREFSENGLL